MKLPFGVDSVEALVVRPASCAWGLVERSIAEESVPKSLFSENVVSVAVRLNSLGRTLKRAAAKKLEPFVAESGGVSSFSFADDECCSESVELTDSSFRNGDSISTSGVFSIVDFVVDRLNSRSWKVRPSSPERTSFAVDSAVGAFLVFLVIFAKNPSRGISGVESTGVSQTSDEGFS
jgi:hypothetical protein